MLFRSGGAVIARFKDLLHDREVMMEADGLIVCTGYTWRKQHPLLQDLAPYLARDAKGSYQVGRNYRLGADPALAAGVFLQGFAEETHGASETVLSLLPVRAGDIVRNLLSARAAVESYTI